MIFRSELMKWGSNAAIKIQHSGLQVYRMSGDLSYLLRAVVEDMKGYDKLYKQLIKAN